MGVRYGSFWASVVCPFSVIQVQGALPGLQERGQCAARVRSAALLSPIESFGTDSYCIVVRVLDPDGLEFAYNLRVHTLRINGLRVDVCSRNQNGELAEVSTWGPRCSRASTAAIGAEFAKAIAVERT